MIDTTLLYDGTITAEFDPVKHKYTIHTIDGIRKPPSTTGVTGVVDKSGALVNWSINNTLEVVRDRIQPGKKYTQKQLQEIFDAAKVASRAKKEEAAGIGTLAHDWLEKYFKGEENPLPDDPRVVSCITAAREWYKSQNVEFLHNERTIYSKKHDYTGRFDGIYRKGKIKGILDFKTGNGIYPEAVMQVSGYTGAYEEEFGEGQIDLRTIIRLGKTDGKFYTVTYGRETYQRDYQAFLSALNLYRTLKDIKKEFEDNKSLLDELTQ